MARAASSRREQLGNRAFKADRKRGDAAGTGIPMGAKMPFMCEPFGAAGERNSPNGRACKEPWRRVGEIW